MPGAPSTIARLRVDSIELRSYEGHTPFEQFRLMNATSRFQSTSATTAPPTSTPPPAIVAQPMVRPAPPPVVSVLGAGGGGDGAAGGGRGAWSATVREASPPSGRVISLRKGVAPAATPVTTWLPGSRGTGCLRVSGLTTTSSTRTAASGGVPKGSTKLRRATYLESASTRSWADRTTSRSVAALVVSSC